MIFSYKLYYKRFVFRSIYYLLNHGAVCIEINDYHLISIFQKLLDEKLIEHIGHGQRNFLCGVYLFYITSMTPDSSPQPVTGNRSISSFCAYTKNLIEFCLVFQPLTDWPLSAISLVVCDVLWPPRCKLHVLSPCNDAWNHHLNHIYADSADAFYFDKEWVEVTLAVLPNDCMFYPSTSNALNLQRRTVSPQKHSGQSSYTPNTAHSLSEGQFGCSNLFSK